MARTGYTGEDGYEIFSSHRAAIALWKELLGRGVRPCGLGARDVLRIEAGFPLYGQDINDGVTPCDSGLGWTVKLHKKSFIGQQALRDYRAKYALIKLLVERGIPRAGHSVLNESGQEVGQVTSGTMSVTLGQGIAMAHIKPSEAAQKKFVVKIRNKNYDALPQTGSFIRGAKRP